jgi:hypothetical protein
MLTFVTLILAVAGAVMIYGAFNIWRESQLMAATQTVSVNDLKRLPPGSLVELKGVLRSSSPIEAEFSKERCLYHCSRIEEEHESRSSSGKTETDTREVHRNERWSPVWFEDPTGQCRIKPESAKAEATEILDRRDTTGLGGLSLSFGGFSLGNTLKARRYKEDIIRPDQAIYVLGTVHEDGSIGADPKKSHPLIISTNSEEQRAKSNRSNILWLGLIGPVFLLIASFAGYHAWFR